MLVGYARVSTKHQNLEPQIESLKNIGCEEIFQEKKSGTTKHGREELENALKFVRKNDTLVVTRLDRCARSIKDLHDIIAQLHKKDVGFKCTEQSLDIPVPKNGKIDPMAKLLLNQLASFAEFEADIRAERQADGIRNAIEKGIKFGAKAKINKDEIDEIIELKNNGVSASKIALQFNIDRSSVYRLIKENI
jgi:DNA invertase Pin-like site-specific DNA recombinase